MIFRSFIFINTQSAQLYNFAECFFYTTLRKKVFFSLQCLYLLRFSMFQSIFHSILRLFSLVSYFQ